MNAVKKQKKIAITTDVLVVIMKKELKLKQSLHQILQILSITVFEKVPIYQPLNETNKSQINIAFDNTLSLFDL